MSLGTRARNGLPACHTRRTRRSFLEIALWAPRPEPAHDVGIALDGVLHGRSRAPDRKWSHTRSAVASDRMPGRVIGAFRELRGSMPPSCGLVCGFGTGNVPSSHRPRLLVIRAMAVAATNGQSAARRADVGSS